jgi:hypothetical protein
MQAIVGVCVAEMRAASQTRQPLTASGANTVQPQDLAAGTDGDVLCGTILGALLGAARKKKMDGGVGRDGEEFGRSFGVPLTVVSDHQTLGMRVEMKQLGRVSAKQPR